MIARKREPKSDVPILLVKTDEDVENKYTNYNFEGPRRNITS